MIRPEKDLAEEKKGLAGREKDRMGREKGPAEQQKDLSGRDERNRSLKKRKEQIRQEIRLLRRELDPEKKKKMDEEILANIWDFLMPEKKPVFLYASIGKEVDTWALLERLWKEKIPVALPRVEGPLIRFYWVKSKKELAPGTMGIREPVDGCPEASPHSAVVLTPGLAFSSDGRRIGYGGGYYDRFFAGRKDLLRVGLAYPFQIREDLPDDPRDEPLDRIFTPERIYICNGIRRT